jgi:hypothetical protein
MITRPLDNDQYKEQIQLLARETDFRAAWEASDLNTPEGFSMTIRYSDHIGSYMDAMIEDAPLTTETELWALYEPLMAFYANWIDVHITRLEGSNDSLRSKLDRAVS